MKRIAAVVLSRRQSSSAIKPLGGCRRPGETLGPRRELLALARQQRPQVGSVVDAWSALGPVPATDASGVDGAGE